jgi:hypothetical protein
MRHRVALMWMALGLVLAGSAAAHDATQVVYDLSTLRTPQVTQTAHRAPSNIALPADPTPLATPSLQRNPGNEPLLDDSNREVMDPKRTRHAGVGAGSPRGGNDNPPTNPSPTPEPGTLMLLGGALASGARFFRRR